MSASIHTETTGTSHGIVTALVRSGSPSRSLTVFLHGIGSNAASFRPLLAALPDVMPSLAWDAPGSGGSTPLSELWPLATDYAETLMAFLDARGRDGAVNIVGHSLGCLMAAAFARRHPGRVKRMVLMAPALGYGVARGGTEYGSDARAVVSAHQRRSGCVLGARIDARRGENSVVHLWPSTFLYAESSKLPEPYMPVGRKMFNVV